MQVLVNARGFSPTPAELTAVISHMRMYCKSSKTEDEMQTVANIDTKVNPRSLWGLERVKQGQLKYLASRNSDNEPSRHHIGNICDFATNLERRLQPLWNTPYWTMPLEVPLVEFGYAAAPVTRLRQHREHQSSNYIMNLAEAICLTLFGFDYPMEQYVVFHIFRVEQAVAAEILFTRLGQGYTADGGGFSHALAGRSNDSAMNISAVEWRKFIKDAWDHSPYRGAMDAFIDATKRRTSEQAARKQALIAAIAERREAMKKVSAGKNVVDE